MQRKHERAGWAPTVSSWSTGGIFQWPEGSPQGVWNLNPKPGSPAYSTRAGEEPRSHPAVKSSRVSICQGEVPGNTDSLLKGQSTKFHLWPLSLGADKGRAEWTRHAWGESGVGGSGEEMEETATRIPTLSHPPHCRSHLSQAELSPLNGIRLRGSNSLTHRNDSAPPSGALHWLLITDWLY